MTLLALASKQIWPQVLAVLYARPDRLVLFHSDELSESRNPAERLAEFFKQGAIQNPPLVELRRVRHDSFKDVVDVFADTAEKSQLDESNCRVHLSGGNKLMAMAATEWCRLSDVPFFYLERDFRVFQFLPRNGELQPQEDFRLDPNLAQHVDPVALMRCQLGATDITNPGQRLTLSDTGRRLPEAEFQVLLKKEHNFRKCLIQDCEELSPAAGHDLEYATAFVLLKLGVPVVQRSVRLAPKLSGASEEGELDLVFNWGGKLSVVDCKDRHSAENKVEKIRSELITQITVLPPLTQMLNQLEDELRQRELHALKDDIQAVSEVGGLLGRAICVRRAPLPPHAEQFAQSRRIEVVLKQRLFTGLRRILFPADPSSRPQLLSAAEARGRLSP